MPSKVDSFGAGVVGCWFGGWGGVLFHKWYQKVAVQSDLLLIFSVEFLPIFILLYYALTGNFPFSHAENLWINLSYISLLSVDVVPCIRNWGFFASISLLFIVLFNSVNMEAWTSTVYHDSRVYTFGILGRNLFRILEQ